MQAHSSENTSHACDVDKPYRDPVCGMRVKAGTAHRCRHQETDYYFCCNGCLTKFQADPARFLTPANEPIAEPPPGSHFVCPMHPEVESPVPADCPLCGMRLEAATPSATDDDAETRRLARLLWWTLPFTVAVVVLAMRGHGARLPRQAMIELLLSLPVMWGAGGLVWSRFAASIKHRSPNMWTLIGLGTGAAFLYSVVATLAPQFFPRALTTEGRVAVYFEAATAILSLTLFGQWLEAKARAQTGSAIRALLKLAPPTARRIAADGSEHDVALAKIAVGDRLRVRPGERIPVDGKVLEGISAVNEAMLTGEPIPVPKSPGANLLGASLNEQGTLVMRATHIGAATVLARIVRLVAEAQRSKAPLQRLADLVAGRFVAGVGLIACMTFVLWGMLGPAPSWVFGFLNAIAVLIIACPCALGLATPMSVTVALGRAAQSGVLFRDAAVLEALAAVDTLVVDKTGTLTMGAPRLLQITPLLGEEQTADSVLRLAGSLERGSEHPLARALTNAAQSRGLALVNPTSFVTSPGAGVRGTVEGDELLIGNQRFLESAGVDCARAALAAATPPDAGEIWLAVNGRAAARFLVTDEIKSTTAAALNKLKADGLEIIMASGDRQASADAVGAKLEIEVRAELTPEDKHALIRQLIAQGRHVAMAGDGINDAPALAAASVGIAMGDGTDVAIASAGVTLLKGDLRGIVSARNIARETVTNMKQNLGLALAYNALAIPLAAGVLYPFTGWLLSPMIAAATMSVSSVSVIANALRLRKHSPT